MRLKSILQKSVLISFIYNQYRLFLSRDYFCINAKVINRGSGTFHKMIVGKDNLIRIGKETKLHGTVFHIKGNQNIIEIGDNCTIGKGCSFWIEANNAKIIIGNGTTFVQHIHFNAQEEGMQINVGSSCMFSNHIVVRTSDSHPIYDIETGERINPAKNVTIGNNVWVAPDTKIMKGACIGDGCVIGSNSMVNKVIDANTLAVGTPARVAKTNIRWTREEIRY